MKPRLGPPIVLLYPLGGGFPYFGELPQMGACGFPKQRPKRHLGSRAFCAKGSLGFLLGAGGGSWIPERVPEGALQVVPLNHISLKIGNPPGASKQETPIYANAAVRLTLSDTHLRSLFSWWWLSAQNTPSLQRAYNTHGRIRQIVPIGGGGFLEIWVAGVSQERHLLIF